MRHLKIIITLFISLFFLTACYRNYEVYGFKPVEKKFEWGLVGAKLMGSESRKGNTIIKNSPYELFLWFGSETFMEGAISIEGIKLLNKRTGNSVFIKNETPEKRIEEQTNLYRAYFSFENIKIPYENIELQMTFRLKQDDNSTEYKVNLLFKTDHQKFRRIVGV